MKPTFYITTPIYYVNAKPHIGHSYTSIACDVLARFKRMTGYQVYFLTGTDEHGQKVAQAAKALNIEPQALVDKNVLTYQNLWKALNISHDDFIRTTESRHKEVVQAFFAELYKKGDIYPDQYEGWYCVPCETFWQESQLEKNLCPDCGCPLEKVSEKTYLFKMSKYEKPLLDFLEKHPDFVYPHGRFNEIISFVKSGLKDLSVSRPKARISWGITCPFDEEQVIYVWFDALVNYLSALGYKKHQDLFDRFWPVDIQMIGKDILKFHAVIWPTMLLAAEVPLPKKVIAHGWWTVDGQKMSKSKGNVVDPYTIIAKVGIDAYRYFLLREVPFGLDGNFSEAALHSRYQADLANNLGNLLNRTLTMLEKYFDGIVPDPGPRIRVDNFKEPAGNLLPDMEKKLADAAFSQALESIWVIIDLANKYIEEEAPWKLAKTDRGRLAVVLYTLTDVLRLVAAYLYPFMPGSAARIWEQLGLSESLAAINLKEISLGQIPAGTKVQKGVPLFPKLVP